MTKSEVELEYERIGTVDWGGGDFGIMVFKDYEQNFYVDRDMVGGGDIMNDAIYERNTLFEERCNLNLISIPASREDTVVRVHTEVQSNSGDFQVGATSTDLSAGLATSDHLYNWLELDIDYNRSWWDKGALEFTLGEGVYMMNGTFNVASVGGTFAMVFNKNEFDRTGRAYPYTTVSEGKWTLDYFESLLADYSEDNGDNVWDENDTYAFASSSGYEDTFFYGSDLKYVKIDEEGEPTFNLVGGQLDKASELVERVQTIYHENNTSMDSTDLHHCFAAFKEGRALMYGDCCAWVISLNKSMEDDYGVIPIPKYDEKQEKYLTWVSFWPPIFALPRNIAQTDILGDVLTVYSLISHENVYPKYFDVVLSAKSTKDPESIKMLEIIFSNRVYDMGKYFSALKMDWLFFNAIDKNNDTFTSELKSLKRSFTTNVNKILKELEK